jgi:predicted permease
MSMVFLAVLPVFLLIGVGMALDRLRVLPESFAGQLSQYALKVAMPCLLLRVVAEAGISLASVGGFLLAMLLAQSIMFALAYAWLAREDGCTPEIAIAALCCACSNAGFLGLPIVDSLLPGNREALVAAGLACILTPLVLVCSQSILEMQIRGRSSRRGIPLVVLRTVLSNPFIAATIIGMIVNASGVGLWAPADRVMSMLGATGAPCALLALGLDMWRKLDIARRFARPNRLRRQSLIMLSKLVIHPLLGWALLSACGVSGVWLAVGVLMAGTSTAVMAYALAEVSGVIPEECALSLVLSAFLSMFTIPALSLALLAAGQM